MAYSIKLISKYVIFNMYAELNACMRKRLGACMRLLGACMRKRLGAKYTVVGCKSMESFGCMSMPFGCIAYCIAVQAV